MISMTKKYRYKNGKEARILCTDGNDKDYPVVSMTPNGQAVDHTTIGLPRSWRDEYQLIEITCEHCGQSVAEQYHYKREFAARITELETALSKIRKDSMYLINGLHGGRASKYFPHMVDNIIDRVLPEESK